MKSAILFCAVLAISCVNGLPDGATLRASSVTTVSLIKGQGYPVEEHTVQTSDGYILTMHRIPYSPKLGSAGGQRPVAFLQHGLLCSSSDWVLAGSKQGLAYILSDAGFDVWMGNARGNTYSKKHATKTPLLQPFWNFDWHEIGIYDLPAMIDYVLYMTGEAQLRYFGHSQGTTAFLVLQSLIPRFRSRIRSAHLLAPVAFMGHMQTPLATVFCPLVGQPNGLSELFGSAEFLPNTKAMELLGSVMCKESSITNDLLCTNALFLIAGWGSPHYDDSLTANVMATTPAGCSINQIMHYCQEYQKGYFRQWDHGKTRNKKEYGNKEPPNYPLDQINVPLFLYYSDNDYFAAIVDVDRLRIELEPGVVRRAHRLPYPKWNHLDFLWAKDIKELLYDIVLEDVQNS